MPNDEIIIIKPHLVVSPYSAELTASRLREIADALDAGEIDTHDEDPDDVRS